MYDVIKGGKKLGYMSVKKNETSSQTFYEIDSKVTFKVLMSFKINYTSTSEYKGSTLIKEYTHNELNGTTQKKSTIWWDGSKYTLNLDGSKITLKQKINYSAACIYHQEPRDGQKVYSPQFAKYLTFKKVGTHTYEMVSPDGLNVYKYTNGFCTEVKLTRDFARFSFVATPETMKTIGK